MLHQMINKPSATTASPLLGCAVNQDASKVSTLTALLLLSNLLKMQNRDRAPWSAFFFVGC